MSASGQTRRTFLAAFGAAWDFSSTYSFHVLGLLKPRSLVLRALDDSLEVTTGSASRRLEPSGTLAFNIDDVPLTACRVGGGFVQFELAIPAVLRRVYLGTLQVVEREGVLAPVVSMDRETAVRSILGAELPVSQAPLEALAAQAIVTRSFLVAAGRRHNGWDFCDTTHCQFLRTPAGAGSPVARATSETGGLTLNISQGPFPARYSAACGGQTESKFERGFLYQSVACEICRSRHLARRGHGLGLCQEGAMGYASRGWTYSRILAKFFPGAEVR